MQTKLPKAKTCVPPFGNRIEPISRDLTPAHYHDHETVYLYNPRKQGMRFTPTKPDSLTMLDQKDSFIVLHNKNKDHEGSREDELYKFEQLKTSNDVMIDYVSNQLALELANSPKNMTKKRQISPEDIKNVISAPNRALTPNGPSRSKKRAPPKPRNR